MCLANPARIISIDGENAVVELNGVKRAVVIDFIDDPKVGDYVLLHAGFAIHKWSGEDVDEYRRILSEIRHTGA